MTFSNDACLVGPYIVDPEYTSCPVVPVLTTSRYLPVKHLSCHMNYQ